MPQHVLRAIRDSGVRLNAFLSRPRTIPRPITFLLMIPVGLYAGGFFWGFFLNVHFSDRVHAVLILAALCAIAAYRPSRSLTAKVCRDPRGKVFLAAAIFSASCFQVRVRTISPSFTIPSGPVAASGLVGSYATTARGGMKLVIRADGTALLRYPGAPEGMESRWRLRAFEQLDHYEVPPQRWSGFPIDLRPEMIELEPFVHPLEGSGHEARVPTRALPVMLCGDIGRALCFQIENHYVFMRDDWPWYWAPYAWIRRLSLGET